MLSMPWTSRPSPCFRSGVDELLDSPIVPELPKVDFAAMDQELAKVATFLSAFQVTTVPCLRDAKISSVTPIRRIVAEPTHRPYFLKPDQQ